MDRRREHDSAGTQRRLDQGFCCRQRHADAARRGHAQLPVGWPLLPGTRKRGRLSRTDLSDNDVCDRRRRVGLAGLQHRRLGSRDHCQRRVLQGVRRYVAEPVGRRRHGAVWFHVFPASWPHAWHDLLLPHFHRRQRGERDAEVGGGQGRAGVPDCCGLRVYARCPKLDCPQWREFYAGRCHRCGWRRLDHFVGGRAWWSHAGSRARHRWFDSKSLCGLCGCDDDGWLEWWWCGCWYRWRWWWCDGYSCGWCGGGESRAGGGWWWRCRIVRIGWCGWWLDGWSGNVDECGKFGWYWWVAVGGWYGWLVVGLYRGRGGYAERGWRGCCWGSQ